MYLLESGLCSDTFYNLISVRATSRSVGPEPVLIDISSRNEKVKGGLEGLLGIVDGEVPTIPSCCTESTGRICQMVEDKGRALIRSVLQTPLVHGISCRVIEKRILSPPGGWAAYTH
jgi:hypothetical protein